MLGNRDLRVAGPSEVRKQAGSEGSDKDQSWGPDSDQLLPDG